jgi:hypothetical protein
VIVALACTAAGTVVVEYGGSGRGSSQAHQQVTVPTSVPPTAAAAAAAHTGPVQMPPDEPMPADAPCARTPRSPGWVSAENRKPGTPGWKPSSEASTKIKGYLGEVSGVCGQSIDLHLSSTGPAAAAVVAAYRVGWYGGVGARLVWTSSPYVPAHHATKLSGAPLYMTETEWPDSVKIKITPDWTPGFYVFEVRASGAHGGGEAIPFVVRDDSGPSHSGTSPLLFQASVLTYQAYNEFGGYSTYHGSHGSTDLADRSRVASFDRPYAGSGYQCPFMYDIPVVSQMESHGFDVDYTTDIDVDERPSQVAAHKALIIGGHSEYWTERMYDAAIAARDKGTNIAFFGANTVYWHARLEPSPSGPDRHMVVYRFASEDPLAKSDPSSTSVEWRQAPLNRPEQALVGADYTSFGVTEGAFRVLDASSWIFAGTHLNESDELTSSVQGEFDTVHPGQPTTPSDIDVIAAAPVMLFGTPTEATMSYYTAPSGAGVFSGGVTYWPCMANASCPVPPATAAALNQMTGNILEAFAAGPAGQQHPSTSKPGPTAAALVSTAKTQQSVAVRAG